MTWGCHTDMNAGSPTPLLWGPTGALTVRTEARKDIASFHADELLQKMGTLDFDASKSNQVYGKASTNQPASLRLSLLVRY